MSFIHQKPSEFAHYSKLDLSLDILKIWNGKVYIIDAGVIPADAKHPLSYEEDTKKLSSHAKIKIRSKCSNVLKLYYLIRGRTNYKCKYESQEYCCPVTMWKQ